MKNQITLSLIALITFGFFSPVRAMDESDPYRFGPIQIEEPLTDADRAEVLEVIQKIKKCNWHPPDRQYTNTRTIIAKAVRCGHKEVEFFNEVLKAALYGINDYYLVKDLLEHGADANERVLGDPLIFLAQTKPMAQLLIKHGADFTQEDWGRDSVIHKASQAEYTPELLAYYLQFPELNVNAARSFSHFTPLHNWALFSLGIGIADARQLPSAREKLRILIRAGARLDLRDMCGRTPFDILEEEYQRAVRSYESSSSYMKDFYAPKIPAWKVLIDDFRRAMNSETIAERN